MLLTRFDRGYMRRRFLDQMARGVLVTGVLAPLYETLAATGSIEKAYPDELLSIESYTRGKLKTGDFISADNVETVKELLTPIVYKQVAKLGRRLKIGPTTTDIMRLSPWEYLQATFANRGKAKLDDRGNVVTLDGKPWIGGNPFPDPRTAVDLFAGLTLSWGRHDASFYAIKEYDISEQGEVQYQYELAWAELSPVARTVLEPKPYWTGYEDKLRFQCVFFTAPNSVHGTSFLNIWPYDQRSFPELYGYVPDFRRVRQFPTDQRFEPLVPGSSLYLSDAWAAGDPLYTWGNYRIIGRGPMLAAVSGGWNADHPNWEHTVHGGPKNQTFWDTTVELVPEAIVTEAEPTGFPRAPVGKKRVWFDARTQLPLGMVSFDRRGDAFRSFDGAYALYDTGTRRVMDGAHPLWSWGQVHAFDIQTGRMTRMEQTRSINGGFTSSANDPKLYDSYLTRSALMRLGNR